MRVDIGLRPMSYFMTGYTYVIHKNLSFHDLSSDFSLEVLTSHFPP
jgi:hypothetical protein